MWKPKTVATFIHTYKLAKPRGKSSVAADGLLVVMGRKAFVNNKDGGGNVENNVYILKHKNESNMYLPPFEKISR